MNDKHEKDLEKIQREVAGIPQDVLDAFLRRLERYSYSARLDAHLAVRNSLFTEDHREMLTNGAFGYYWARLD